MTNKLAENIRAFRKQRSLTQEQLAEVLGVTTGAVYKWEAKLSQPELSMLMELADFFDTSVDVLLGYEMKDNRLGASVARIKQCRREKDRAGFEEAEKALKKYPNVFDVVYNSAVLYSSFGIECGDKPILIRAMELLRQSLLLIAQNTDPEINESTIHGVMAEVLLCLGDAEQAVEMLKKHNAAGMYNDIIGMTLASHCKRTGEALPYLSDALLDHVVALIRIIMGYVNVFFDDTKDYASAEAMLQWGIDMLNGLKNGERAGFVDKMNALFLTCLAYAREKSGNDAGARDALLQAFRLARGFDAAPDYDLATLRFAVQKERKSAYDDLGTSAMAGVENTIGALENAALSAIWKGIKENED